MVDSMGLSNCCEFGVPLASHKSIIYKDFVLTSQKITSLVLRKSQLFLFKAMFGPKIYTKNVKKRQKLKVMKFKKPFAFNRDVIHKKNMKVVEVPPSLPLAEAYGKIKNLKLKMFSYCLLFHA